LIKELGDTMWYVAQACIALDVSFDEVIQTNIDKLMKRYPDGFFDVYYSENREEGDI
jgi:NTP pyrophosphatase (non-canonical NTP hydrolase)